MREGIYYELVLQGPNNQTVTIAATMAEGKDLPVGTVMELKPISLLTENR